MVHGGDILTYKNMTNEEIIDFSSNINPLGPPKGLKKVIDEAYSELIMYPDIHYRELKENIANYLGCSLAKVIVGNGALEIINNFCLMFRRTVVFIPCFSEYIKRSEVFEKEVLKLPLDSKFHIDIEALEQNLRVGDILILGNPNNPTGFRIEKQTLIQIQSIVKEKDAFLLLDEAFFEFCPNDYDSITLFEGEDNVCVIRAATKIFALPGIRLGYGVVSSNFIQKYIDVESPWSVNSYANAAGRCIFKDKNYIEKTKNYIQKERKYLLDNLSKIEWIMPFESQTNFILIKLLKYNEDIIFQKFIEKGILIRKTSSFDGLSNNYIRIAVKDHKCNEKLINIFREI